MVRPSASSLAGSLLLAAILAACGGGGGGTAPADTPPPPPVGTSLFTSGAISGFGSVIVNGVRFDDSGAEVLDDEGRHHERDELKLGEQVEIEASSIDRDAGRGVATRIRFGSEMVGPVTSIDTAAQTVQVLGQKVAVSAQTVFDDDLAGGLAAVQVGDVLEIHARFDAAQGQYQATRIEREDSPAAFKLRGIVAALDSAAHTFRIGSATIDFAGSTEVPPQLANGMTVRVRLATAQSGGSWSATRVQRDERHDDDLGEAEHEVEDFELHGPIVTLDAAGHTFTVRGVVVAYTDATVFRDMSADDLAVGAQVEVKGGLSADGTRVDATRISQED